MSDDNDNEAGGEAQAARILTGQEWPITVTLRFPIAWGKGPAITELVFQKGRVGFLKGMRTDAMPDAAQTMLLASRLCGQPVDVIERLDPDDAREVMAIALGFFARCLAT